MYGLASIRSGIGGVEKMNNSARIIKNFIEFQRNVSTEKAIHSLEELKRFVMWDDVENNSFSADAYEAIDLAIDALKKQLTRLQ